MTRQTKTPQQRAEEALGVAERRVEKLKRERDKHAAEHDRVTGELADAEARRDYLSGNPDLPKTTVSGAPDTPAP